MEEGSRSTQSTAELRPSAASRRAPWEQVPSSGGSHHPQMWPFSSQPRKQGGPLLWFSRQQRPQCLAPREVPRGPARVSSVLARMSAQDFPKHQRGSGAGTDGGH